MTDDKRERIEFVQPAGWKTPRGYANGVSVRGRTLYVGGQIGWNADQQFECEDVAGQFAQTLDNVLAVVAAAGGTPSDVVKMTCYCTDLPGYRGGLREIGAAWRERFGKHYPAMALVGVPALVEEKAKIEIEAIASLPEDA